MRFQAIVIVFLLSPFAIGARSVSSSDTTLLGYIERSLNSNLTLLSIQNDYSASLNALDIAKSYYYPNIAFQARYTRAGGGRTFDIPVGDMLNPVYSSLNMLTQFLPPPNRFPNITLDNMEVEFLRPREHETKISLVQPLFQPAIYHQTKMKQSESDAAAVDIERYRLELITEVCRAYYQVKMLLATEEVLRASELLLKENRRVNNSLMENGKATAEVLWQSEALIAGLGKKMADLQQQLTMAKAYLNFLCNTSLEEPIRIVTFQPDTALLSRVDIGTGQPLIAKPEMLMLNHFADALLHARSAKRSSLFPSVFAVVDYGLQGEKYRITTDDDFLIASVVLRWELFQGYRNRRDIQGIDIQLDNMRLQKMHLANILEMQRLDARTSFDAAISAHNYALAELKAAEITFFSIERRYREGEGLMLEYTSAHTALQQAALFEVIAGYDTVSKLIEYLKSESENSELFLNHLKKLL